MLTFTRYTFYPQLRMTDLTRIGPCSACKRWSGIIMPSFHKATLEPFYSGPLAQFRPKRARKHQVTSVLHLCTRVVTAISALLLSSASHTVHRGKKSDDDAAPHADYRSNAALQKVAMELIGQLVRSITPGTPEYDELRERIEAGMEEWLADHDHAQVVLVALDGDLLIVS
jgi:hypothetical protein